MTSSSQLAIEKCLSLWDDDTEASITAQKEVQKVLASEKETDANKAALSKIKELQDYFSDKDVLIIGGDGWAYDIGYGGVDHVVASGKNVTILVLDTEEHPVLSATTDSRLRSASRKL